MSDTKTKPSAYRREIDGLRSIAVLSVLLYHFSVPGFSGGFVGVDIFFVISGFLIGSILWREMGRNGTISLSNFYARRFRRLAPAFVAMSVFTLAVAAIIFMPYEFRELGKSMIAATVYLSNIYFYQHAGYFDTVSENNALLHTWSLAIEEQFYVFLPLFLLLFAKRQSWSLPVLGTLGAASLLACIVFTQQNHVAAFYLFPFRAWELLLGVCYALYIADRPHLTHARFPALVSWAGLALIAGSIFLIKPGTHFPGIQAVFPVLGSMLILANGSAPNAVNKALSHPAPVMIGLMSYSLYLWHWPVLILSKYYRGEYGSPLEYGLWIALTFALAYASWRYIENPIRFTKSISHKKLFSGVALSSAILLLAGGLIYLRDGFPGRFNRDVLVHVNAADDFIQDWSRCYYPQQGALKDIRVCPIGPEGDPEFLVWGDSHVRALKEGLDLAANEARASGIMIWEGGCPPLFGVVKRESVSTLRNDQECTDQNAQIEAAIDELSSINRVLLIGRWAYYTQGGGIGRDADARIEFETDQPAGPASADPSTPIEVLFDRTLATLQSANKDVYVLRAIPEIAEYNSRDMAKMVAYNKLKTPADFRELTQTPRSTVETRSRRSDEIFNRAAAAGSITLIDPFTQLCDDDTCYGVRRDQSYYFDNNHLTNGGAKEIRSIFMPFFYAEEEG